MTNQALIDKATELINGGKLYKDVAAELGVKPCTVSSWRMKGLIPPAPHTPHQKTPVENQKKKDHQSRQGEISRAPGHADGGAAAGRNTHSGHPHPDN